MTRHGLATPAAYAVLAVAALLEACNPQLNWREVRLGRLTALLPCKPDTASRQVVLEGQQLTMDMAGCEVGQALFAISRVRAGDDVQAAALMAALRRASLSAIAKPVVHPMANSGDAMSSFDVQVDGERANGVPLQARFKWLLAGQEIYQIAAYAEQLGTAQTENLLTAARIQ